MPTPALRSDHHRWRDVDGTRISLFRWVEQVIEDSDPRVLPSRLHQRGQVLGRGLHSLYVCFSDDALVSLPPHLLRLLPDAPDARMPTTPVTGQANDPTPAASTHCYRVGAK